MKIAITGSKGTVAQALIPQLDKSRFEITELDLPENDASDRKALIEATKGHDALIHLAWKGLNVDHVDPINRTMYHNAYWAAFKNNIGTLIMGSSNHARDHAQRELDGRIRFSGHINDNPTNPYGIEKHEMERMGMAFADAEDLNIVCLRIGNVNPEDQPKDVAPSRWLSHRDLGQLVTKVLDAQFEPGHFEVVYGVSEQSDFDWVNSFGYEPEDAS